MVVVHDAAKGRCLQAERALAVGDVVITEDAVVFASYVDEDEVDDGGDGDCDNDGGSGLSDGEPAPTAVAAARGATAGAPAVTLQADASRDWDSVIAQSRAAAMPRDEAVEKVEEQQEEEDEMEEEDDDLVALGNPEVLSLVQRGALCTVGEYRRMARVLEQLPGAESQDTARNFLQLLVLQHCAAAADGGGGGGGDGHAAVFSPALTAQLPLLRALAPSQGLSRCEAAAAELRRQFPEFAPLAALSDVQVRSQPRRCACSSTRACGPADVDEC